MYSVHLYSDFKTSNSFLSRLMLKFDLQWCLHSQTFAVLQTGYDPGLQGNPAQLASSKWQCVPAFRAFAVQIERSHTINNKHIMERNCKDSQTLPYLLACINSSLRKHAHAIYRDFLNCKN